MKNKAKELSFHDQLLEVRKMIDSGEIDGKNISEYEDQFPVLRVTNLIANSIKVMYLATVMYLIIYFFTH